MAIYVNFEIPNTIEEFLQKFYELDYSGSSMKRAKATYFDKECKSIQCVGYKYRSFDDLLEMIQTYYPEATPKDVFHELLSCRLYDKKGRRIDPQLAYCSGMSRIRFIPCNFYGGNLNDIPKYNSKYSWKDLADMLNLKTMDEIKNYSIEQRNLREQKEGFKYNTETLLLEPLETLIEA